MAVMTLAAMQAAPAGQGRAPTRQAPYADALEAWDTGDYPAALAALRGLVERADEPTFEAIALLTGELFQTTEITTAGRLPSFAGSGGRVIYETGPAAAPVIRIVAPGTAQAIAEFPGRRGVTDSAGRHVAYITADGGLAWRAIAGKAGGAISAPGLAVTSHAWSADDATVFFTGGATGATAHDIHAFAIATGATRQLTGAPGLKSALRVVPGGAMLLYTIGARGGGPGGTPAVQGWVDLRSGETGVFEEAATAPAFSADGSTFAYVVRDGAAAKLMIQAGRGPANVIVATRDRLDAPALSDDGSRIAFQRMPREDWEIFVTDREGKTTARVTREIQHDVLPRFLPGNRLLAAIGEPRHRRAQVHDLATGRRARVFHNNTIRTIAPEYSWLVSNDGTKVLIGADRDGDTISVERGIYVVDLSARLPRAAIAARLDAMLAAERQLRTLAARVTKPLAPAIREVLDRASVSRVYGYEKALFDFDSKHISAPGNLKAAEYLHATYAASGYAPGYQWFAPDGALGGRSANVVAVLKGTVSPDVIYVASSHYDSEVGVAGADDNSSGTAALLEVARIMGARPQPATVVFASFTGEEEGTLGAREFVRLATENKWHVAGALNNDMVGWANDHRLDNTIRHSSPAIRDIQHAVAMTFTRLVTYDARYYRGTDTGPFYEAWGSIVGGIGSYPVLGSPHYHQPHDVLETVNHQLVTEVAKTTAATLMVLANRPAPPRGLTAAAQGAGAVITWVPSPERDVRQYLVTWQARGRAAQRRVVTSPRAAIAGAPSGTEVRVVAVNARGLEGWDHARVVVP